MILPNLQNQSFGGNHGILTLPNSVPTIANLNAADVWNKLINNYYGVSSGFANTDQPFIQEWNNTIDLYSQIFRGVTLVLDHQRLTRFPISSIGIRHLLVSSPAPGFASDCGLTNAVPIVQNHQQQCAAVTWVLYHFANPTVGGNNAKAVFEAGMTAARDSFDLGTNGVKWLAADTSAGLTPLPDTLLLSHVQNAWRVYNFLKIFPPPIRAAQGWKGCALTFPMTSPMRHRCKPVHTCTGTHKRAPAQLFPRHFCRSAVWRTRQRDLRQVDI